MKEKREFLESAQQALSEIYDSVRSAPELSLSALEPGRTVLLVVDMVNGFVKEGAMSSPRVGELNKKIASFCKGCSDRGIEVLAFADTHTMESPEFTAYPPHCLQGDWESEVTEEIDRACAFTRISKHSTNGFLEPAFRTWMQEHPQIDCFLIVGDCTDICIQQLALSLKAEFNRKNLPARVVVPAACCDTFDLGMHDGDLMHLMALYSMGAGGVEIVSDVEE